MTLMTAEKPAKIRLKTRHPITGRKPSYRDWWFEHEGVVFRIFADWLGDVWTIEPDTDHTAGSEALVNFVRSDAYWCAVAMTLKEARAKLAEVIASDQFVSLRDAYTNLPVNTPYRQVAWDPSSPAQFYRDRQKGAA